MANCDEGVSPTYDLEACCTPPLIGAPPAVVGPPGPVGPRGVPSFVFVFGSNRAPLTVGERISHPVPTDLDGKSLSKWRSRLLVSSNIEFLLYKAPTQTAVGVALTGTMPQLMAAIGGSADFTDLSDPTLQAGAAIDVEIVAVAGDVKQATLLLEVAP